MTILHFQLIFVLGTALTLVSAAPQKPEEPIAIISQNSKYNPDGSYEYRSVSSSPYKLCPPAVFSEDMHGVTLVKSVL
jgi:hypothetical protein